jgi:RNA polymerase sigma factor (TIGR02999 family)
MTETQTDRGDALARLMPLVYPELRRLAGGYMRMERAGHTLQPTALVHEAFLRLAQQHRDWNDRSHLVGVAAQLMRHLLVDHARQRTAAKRVNSGEAATACAIPAEEVLAVNEALEVLEKLDSQQARVIELRYFGGLSTEETAEAMGICSRTVKREWAVAKGWLRARLAARAPS